MIEVYLEVDLKLNKLFEDFKLRLYLPIIKTLNETFSLNSSA